MQSRSRSTDRRGRGRADPPATAGESAVENRRLRAERKALKCELRILRTDINDLRVELAQKLEQERTLRKLVSRYERAIWPLLVGVKIVCWIALVNLPPVGAAWWTAAAISTVTLGVSAYIGKPYASHAWSSILTPALNRVRARWHPAGCSLDDDAQPSS
jgi:hypothetical protein